MKAQPTKRVTLAALVLLGTASVCLAPHWRLLVGIDWLWVPGAVLACGGILLVGRQIRQYPSTQSVPLIPSTTNRGTWSFQRIDIALTGGGVVLLGLAVGVPLAVSLPEWPQLVVLVGGVATLSAGMAGLRPPYVVALVKGWQHIPLWERLALGTIFLLALSVRLWQLEGGLRVLIDEMQTIEPIVRMWDRDFPLLQQISANSYPYPLLYPYLQQIGSALFGHSLFTLRLPGAIYGAMSVFSVYWFARLLYPDKHQLPMITALALAVFPMHVHFSRIAILNLYDPTLAVLAGAFAIRGIKHGLRQDWALAGIMLGLITYLYEGGRILQAPILLLWIAIIVFQYRHTINLGHLLRGVAWMLLVMVLLALPLYATWLANGDPLFARLASEGVTNWPQAVNATRFKPIHHNLADAFGLYVAKPDGWSFYGGLHPIVPLFAQPFFLIGLTAALTERQRRALGAFPALWVLVTTLLVGLFIWNPQHAARYTVVMIAIAMLIALGTWWAAQLLGNGRRWVTWTLAVLLAMAQVVYYFGFHLDEVNIRARVIHCYADPDDAVLRAATLPPNTHIYLITQTATFPAKRPPLFLSYLTHNASQNLVVVAQDSATYDDAIFINPSTDINHAYFIETTNTHLIDAIIAAQPTIEPSFSPDPRVPLDLQFVLLYLPAEATPPNAN